MAASKKLYTAVADTFGRCMFFAESDHDRSVLETAVNAIAHDFADDNPAFSKMLFLDRISARYFALNQEAKLRQEAQ